MKSQPLSGIPMSSPELLPGETQKDKMNRLQDWVRKMANLKQKNQEEYEARLELKRIDAEKSRHEAEMKMMEMNAMRQDDLRRVEAHRAAMAAKQIAEQTEA